VQSYFRKNDIEANSELRTTISPSIIQGGFRSNVIPSEATATLDIRAVAWEDMPKFKAEMMRIIDDPAVRIDDGVQEPHLRVHDGYRHVSRSGERGEADLPRCGYAAWMSTGGSDMLNLRIKGCSANGIGAEVPKEDLVTHAIHGDNERIKEDGLLQIYPLQLR